MKPTITKYRCVCLKNIEINAIMRPDFQLLHVLPFKHFHTLKVCCASDSFQWSGICLAQIVINLEDIKSPQSLLHRVQPY